MKDKTDLERGEAQYHISSLTQIIETRKKLKLSTFCAFIDFKKGYDLINRGILWHKLENFEQNNKLLSAIKSIYNNVLCSREAKWIFD